MSETLHNGFSRENVERIYRGEPALVDGQMPAELLPGERLGVVSLMAEGLAHREIRAAMDMNIYDIRQHVAFGLNQLGVVSHTQLAGFFPLDPEHETLQGKSLSDLLAKTVGLTIVQSLSTGSTYEQIAAETHKTKNAVKQSTSYIAQAWPDVERGLPLIRVANALRARYVQSIETFGTLDSDYVHRLTLPALVEVEPTIERLFMEDRGAERPAVLS